MKKILEYFAFFFLAGAVSHAGDVVTANDLNPVKFKAKPAHAPVALVENGKSKASIAVMGAGSVPLNHAVQELQKAIEAATGVKLPIVQGKITAPAIVVGDCDLARKHGLVGKDMPVEGFAVKTIPDHVLIVGRDENVIANIRSDGTAWGLSEFLERFVGEEPGICRKVSPHSNPCTVDRCAVGFIHLKSLERSSLTLNARMAVCVLVNKNGRV